MDTVKRDATDATVECENKQFDIDELTGILGEYLAMYDENKIPDFIAQKLQEAYNTCVSFANGADFCKDDRLFLYQRLPVDNLAVVLGIIFIEYDAERLYGMTVEDVFGRFLQEEDKQAAFWSQIYVTKEVYISIMQLESTLDSKGLSIADFLDSIKDRKWLIMHKLEEYVLKLRKITGGSFYKTLLKDMYRLSHSYRDLKKLFPLEGTFIGYLLEFESIDEKIEELLSFLSKS